MVSSEGNAPSSPAHTYFASEAYSPVRGLSLSPDPAVTDGAATLSKENIGDEKIGGYSFISEFEASTI